jgi:hypothetical protein
VEEQAIVARRVALEVPGQCPQGAVGQGDGANRAAALRSYKLGWGVTRRPDLPVDTELALQEVELVEPDGGELLTYTP